MARAPKSPPASPIRHCRSSLAALLISSLSFALSNTGHVHLAAETYVPNTTFDLDRY
jgi:hypothetical protein